MTVSCLELDSPLLRASPQQLHSGVTIYGQTRLVDHIAVNISLEYQTKIIRLGDVIDCIIHTFAQMLSSTLIR